MEFTLRRPITLTVTLSLAMFKLDDQAGGNQVR
jgi:hypothetical protein